VATHPFDVADIDGTHVDACPSASPAVLLRPGRFTHKTMFDPNEKISRSDMRLLKRAITEGWDVPVEVRTRAIEQVSYLLEDDRPAYVLAAAKALMTATKLQLDEAAMNRGDKVPEEPPAIHIHVNPTERVSRRLDAGDGRQDALPSGSAD
jgi:hypothetical protein